MLELELQNQLTPEESRRLGVPAAATIRQWIEPLLFRYRQEIEMTLRIVSNKEIQQLNRDYRHKDCPTNVLSFPFDAPPEVELPFIGDIIIAAEVIQSEAKEQGKSLDAHWAHMAVHGTLHLLGHDHIEIDERGEMEEIEIKYLATLGIANPYIMIDELMNDE